MRFHKNTTKLKTLYVLKYFVEQTNETKSASAADIIRYLSSLGIPAERKGIYNDIETFNKFGIHILKKGHEFFYQATEGDFLYEVARSF